MTRHARMIVSDSTDDSFCYVARKVSADLWQVFHGLRVVGTATKAHGGWLCALSPSKRSLHFATDIEQAVDIIHAARTPTATENAHA